MTANRLTRFRQRLDQEGLGGFLITNPANVYYLSGFTGEGHLLVDGQKAVIVTDPRYTEQAEAESKGWEVLTSPKDSGVSALAAGSRLGFESTHLTFRQYQDWREKLGQGLTGTSGLIEDLRIIKESAELDHIRKALAIGDEVFSAIQQEIRPGTAERDLAISIEYRLKKAGCEREAFETIAVSGLRSSLPHGRPSMRRLEAGDLLTLDFGGIWEHYAGDMTRTVAVEKSCARIRDVYHHVLDAQLSAIEAVAPGVLCKEVDEAARGTLRRVELDKHFVHSTGHGLGLDVHEAPTVSWKSDVVLKPNMVITVEPGVYIPGWGGVRIEDVVLVTENGHEVLTSSIKDLLVI
ncbi:MAG: M24 family metallopeptidase [Solirubrobacterales bacterium]